MDHHFRMKVKHNPSARILGELDADFVIDHAMSGKHSRSITHEGRTYSVTRMRVFGMHGRKCQFCGIEGTKIILTQDRVGFGGKGNPGLHLDLYAERNGGFLLMNRDHIIPASKGGKDTIWNMRPCCQLCNTKRGNNFTKKDEKQARVYNFAARIYNRIWYKLGHKWSYRLSLATAKVFA